MKYAIGITTFKRREELLYNLIRSIRKYSNIEIYIMINADYKEDLDQQYIKRIMNFCCEYDNIIPTFFSTFTSLSKMWNTIIINSSKNINLILNDDIELTEDVFIHLEQHINEDCLFTINSSWSHYVISKNKAITLNFFDERLLAFGEEDGDMTWKYENLYNQKHESINISGIRNIAEGYRNTSSKLSLLDINNYVYRPAFNRNFIFGSIYNNGNGPSGMFGSSYTRIIEDEKQYPYEQFKIDNYGKL